MALHHKTLESAVGKYGHLAGKATELITALKADEKAFDDEAINEIFTAITTPKSKAEEKTPQTDTSSHIAKGKKLYDKWRGKWLGKEYITDPFTGKRFYTLWEFVREGTDPNKTNIPLTDAEAEIFNSTRRLCVGNTPTEQLFPAGSTETIFDRYDNPLLPKKV